MTSTVELFRFLTTRRAERVLMHRIDRRLIRDVRPVRTGSMLAVLFGPGPFADKLAAAEAFAGGTDFVAADEPGVRGLEPAVDFFRRRLEADVVIADLRADFELDVPLLAALWAATPPADLVAATLRFLAKAWDSTYATVILGCDDFVSTNYLADSLRVYHVLRLLWIDLVLGRERWTGYAFDEYEVFVDLDRAARAEDPRPAPEPAPGPGPAPVARSGRRRDADPLARLIAPTSAGQADLGLSVGQVTPPVVGDLILTEQELRGYSLGELAQIITIMRGERRERTVRSLSRTSQTTTTETTSSMEDSTSVVTEERFQLAAQAQTTAEQSFGISTGISVSGSFGPVKVGATVNASYDTSKSSAHTTSQEYAKNVTEEATRRVQNSSRQLTSITLLTELQDTDLQGFNNEDGADHVNGLYRWVDSNNDVRLLNYGRRLMWTFTVPEPSAMLHGQLEQAASGLEADLVQPVPPERVSTSTGRPLPDDSTATGFLSFEDVTEYNVAAFAALYDADVAPPPAESITGAKAIAYPEAMEAKEIEDHSNDSNELSYVSADNTLAVDPDYRLASLGVYVPKGKSGLFGWYADTLRLGTGNDSNLILLEIGDRHFYFHAEGEGGGDRSIDSNFNQMQLIHPQDELAGVVQPALPIALTTDFEGILALNVVYTATRRPEALDAWKSTAFAAIVDAYTAKKQAYEQAMALARSTAQSQADARTYQMREDQYRSIERTELKRGCIDLVTQGTAAGHPSIVLEEGVPRIVHDEAEGSTIPDWRSPQANGVVVEYFEKVYAWEDMVYEFYPYYWADRSRWGELSQASGADPVFESFLRAGSASVVVPVRPGFERAAILFLKTGLIWRGTYLPLFSSPDMLDVYEDVELGTQLDPPEQVGEPWQVRLPTSMVMLQPDEILPQFPSQASIRRPEAPFRAGVEPEPPF